MNKPSKYLVRALIAIWTVIVVASLSWNLFLHYRHVRQAGRSQAGEAIRTNDPEGIAVSDPTATVWATWKRHAAGLIVGHTLLWALGFSGIVVFAKRFKREEESRRQAEDALRESEERFWTLFDNSPIGVYQTTPDGRILFANPAMVRMLGCSSLEELAQRDLEDSTYFPTYPRSEFKRRIENEGEIIGLEATWLKQDGSSLFVRENARAVRGPNGEIIYYEGTVEDVSDRKRVEEALRESEGKYSSMVRQANDGIILLQHDLIVFANEAMAKMLGYDAPAEMENTPFIDYVAPESKSLIYERYEARLRGEVVPIHYEGRLLCKNGTIKDVEISGARILYGGEPADQGIIRDITERKRGDEERRKLEAQVQHAQKLESLGVLAGGIAHDFNNLLMAILGNADLALLALSPLSLARENVEEIVKASQHAADLCRQMLAYSGKGRFVVEAINLSEGVKEMAHILSITVSKKVAIKYNFAEDLPSIETDVAQIRQVIMNLITNASEAIGDEIGAVSISTGAMECTRAYLSDSYVGGDLPEGLYVYLEVSDTGCGMDKETTAKIFDPFFTTKFTGRGLGMAAVLGIVRGHKGTIKIRSTLGEGTTFTVLFPVIEGEPATSRQPSADESKISALAGRTVLFADDEKAVLAVTRRMLEKAGAAVLTASDGHSAVDLFREHASEIDCVLIDLTMPKMNGEETFLAMKRIKEDLRAIISSGYSEQECIGRFVGKGVVGFIQKPYQFEELVSKVAAALEA